MIRPSLVVVGDALLDVDVAGTAERLCPDGPAPVVDVEERGVRPGGAGLAALLAARHGAEVTLIAGRGADQPGQRFARLLAPRMSLVDTTFHGSTPCKTRVRAGGQSLVRMDSGDGFVPDQPLGEAVRQALRHAAAVLVADYGRGITFNSWLRRELSRLADGVPLVWDPHPHGAEPVERTDLVVPNRSEALHFAHTHVADSEEHDDPTVAANQLRRRWNCGAVTVTLGSEGAIVVPPESGSVVAAPDIAVTLPDLCGAGDSFAAAATVALLRRATVAEAVRAAVPAASQFVAEGGAGALTVADPDRQTEHFFTTPSPRRVATGELVLASGEEPTAFEVASRIRREGGRLVAAGGCFDLLHPGHLRLLERARALGDALIVCLNSDESVRRRKGPDRPVVSVEGRARVLEALDLVDAVAVFAEDTPCALLAKLRPDVWVKGGDYGEHMPENEVLREHGGKTVRVPLMDGYSTTHLLAARTAV